MKKKRGRPPKTSLKPLTKVIKEENQEVELPSNHNETSNTSIKRKRGRPRSSTKPVDIEIKTEEIEPTPNEDEKADISTKKRPGRPRSSTKSVTKSTDIEEVITPVHRGRKRKITMEENDKQQEESSTDNTNLSIRRSSRPRKSLTIESSFILDSKTPTQVTKFFYIKEKNKSHQFSYLILKRNDQ
jgi:hypothetical protein